MTTQLSEIPANITAQFNPTHLGPEYIDYVQLRDAYGFSVRRDYPEDILYKPPRLSNGAADVNALIHVAYDYFKNRTKGEAVATTRIPIYISATAQSKYLYGRADYNFSDKDCPTKESVELSRKTKKPISLQSDDYFYDSTTDLYFIGNKSYNDIKDLITDLFKKHCDTARLIKGFKVRAQLGARDEAVKICDKTNNFLKWILGYFFGRQLEETEPFAGTLKKYKKSDMKLLSLDSLNILGYQSSKRVVVFYCGIIFLFGLINSKIPCLRDLAFIKQNQLFQVAFVVLTLSALENYGPRSVFYLINKITELRVHLVFKKYKV